MLEEITTKNLLLQVSCYAIFRLKKTVKTLNYIAYTPSRLDGLATQFKMYICGVNTCLSDDIWKLIPNIY